MMLLFVGFAVGLVAAFLLRTLIKIERDGMARVADDVAELIRRTEHLETRVESLEAIAVSDDAPARPGSLGPGVDRREATEDHASSPLRDRASTPGERGRI